MIKRPYVGWISFVMPPMGWIISSILLCREKPEDIRCGRDCFWYSMLGLAVWTIVSMLACSVMLSLLAGVVNEIG